MNKYSFKRFREKRQTDFNLLKNQALSQIEDNNLSLRKGVGYFSIKLWLTQVIHSDFL